MTLDAATLIRHALETLRAPRHEARWVMAHDLSRATRWQALILNTIIGTLLSWVWTNLNIGDGGLALDPVQREVARLVLERPLTVAMVQAGIGVISVFAVYWIGRAFGGQGGFGNTISLMAWLIFVLNVFSLAQILVLFVAPLIAALLGMAALVLIFVLLTSFVAELHGFKSLSKTFLGILFSIFGFFFGLSFFLAMIGASLSGVVP